jgi:hypothetical protein
VWPGANGVNLSLLPTGLTAALSSPDSFIQARQTANTPIANGISGGAANAYSVLLPTAADSGSATQPGLGNG